MKKSLFLVAIVIGFGVSFAVGPNGFIFRPAYGAPTIGTDDLEDGAVTTEKIKDGEVKTLDLANGAVTKDKISPFALKIVVVQRELSFNLLPHSQDGAIVQCNKGEVVTGGGFATGGGMDVHPTISAKNANGWAVVLVNIGSQAPTVNKVFAECAHLELGP